jgi:hypothetical protein
MSSKSLSKLSKVSESITIYRYDNGWMVEVGGRDSEDNWKVAKIICDKENDVTSLVKEWNSKERE